MSKLSTTLKHAAGLGSLAGLGCAVNECKSGYPSLFNVAAAFVVGAGISLAVSANNHFNRCKPSFNTPGIN